MRRTRGGPGGPPRGLVAVLVLALLPAVAGAAPAERAQEAQGKQLPERQTPEQKTPEQKIPEQKIPERQIPDQKPPEKEPTVELRAVPKGVEWVAKTEKADRLVLTVSGEGRVVERQFKAGERPVFELVDAQGAKLGDGSYAWELRVVPQLDDKVRRRLAMAREEGDTRIVEELRSKGYLPKEPVVRSGYFTVRGGELLTAEKPEPPPEPRRDEGSLLVAGDLKVQGAKQFVAPDPADARRAIHFVALEGPEAGTYYRGSATTAGGEAVIDLPDYFARVTETDDVTVQLTPVGGWARLYVAEKSPSRLVIRQATGAEPVEFDFLVQGVRRGYAGFQPVRTDADGGGPARGGQR